jgi:colanic acid biosynthesis glycosyl transferase WcaI
VRVCILTEYFHPDSTGGTGTVLSDLARHLQRHHDDLKIDVITSKNLYRGAAAALPQQEVWGGVTIFRLRTPQSNRPSTALRLAAGLAFTLSVMRRLLLGRRYDVVLVVTNPPSLALSAWLLKRLRKTPYVYLIHDLYPDFAVALGVVAARGFVARVLARAQRAWLHGSRSTIVVGRCMRDHLIAAYHLPPQQIDVIPNWSDPEIFDPHMTSRFREAVGLQGVVAMYAGNLGAYVDLDSILDAASQLLVNHSEVTVVLVGDGAKRAHVAARIAAEALGNVRLFPLVSRRDYPDLLAAADISLVTLMPGAAGLGVPSKFYNILASGRATVALVAPTSEVALVLSEARCGVQVDHGDPSRLSEVLGALAAAPLERARMGRNARDFFIRNYTLPKVADRFYDNLSDSARVSRI